MSGEQRNRQVTKGNSNYNTQQDDQGSRSSWGTYQTHIRHNRTGEARDCQNKTGSTTNMEMNTKTRKIKAVTRGEIDMGTKLTGGGTEREHRSRRKE